MNTIELTILAGLLPKKVEEDLIADEITLETNRLVKTFKYTILEEK